MNNKKYNNSWLVSGLVVAFVILISVFIYNTCSFTNDDAYKFMKNEIVSVSYDYIRDCNNGSIECDFSFLNNNQFSASTLKKAGYIEKIVNPVDGKQIGTCLKIEAVKSNGITVVNLIDNCY